METEFEKYVEAARKFPEEWAAVVQSTLCLIEALENSPVSDAPEARAALEAQRELIALSYEVLTINQAASH